MSARIRQGLKCAVAFTLYYSGLLALWRRIRQHWGRPEVCVLGLHRVLTKEQLACAHSLPAMILSEANFSALLEYLHDHYQLLSAEEFEHASASQDTNGRPACWLTFDDGWADNYTTAYPLLKKHRVPATIFLTTGMISQPGTFWVERWLQLAREQGWERAGKRFAEVTGMAADSPESAVEFLKHMPTQRRDQILAQLTSDAPRGHVGDAMLTWEQVQEMGRDGIDFGAHTATHPLLTFEPPAVVDEELRSPKSALESRLGRPVRAFAYPNGAWNEEVQQRVKEAGYECALTVQRGAHRLGENRYAIRRTFLHDGNVTGWNGRFSPAVFEWTVNR